MPADSYTDEVAVLFAKLLKDESGFIEATNYLLLATILGIGMIAGLASVRDSIVEELGDVSLALESLDQSYTVNCTFGSVVKQFGYADDEAGDDLANPPTAGIEICLPATPE